MDSLLESRALSCSDEDNIIDLFMNWIMVKRLHFLIVPHTNHSLSLPHWGVAPWEVTGPELNELQEGGWPEFWGDGVRNVDREINI